MTKFKSGVLTGKHVQDVFTDAKNNLYALPAVNVTNTSTVNSVIEAAVEANSPVIIQFSAGGCQFFAGKSLNNEEVWFEKLKLLEKFYDENGQLWEIEDWSNGEKLGFRKIN